MCMSVQKYTCAQQKKPSTLVKFSAVKSPVLHYGLLAILQLLY